MRRSRKRKLFGNKRSGDQTFKKIEVKKGADVSSEMDLDQPQDITKNNATSKIEVRKDQVHELCKGLNQSTESFCEEEQIVSWIKKLRAYSNKRLYYSTITDYVYNNHSSENEDDSEDSNEKMLVNLGSILEWADNNHYEETETKLYEQLIRFQDHLSLAVRQYRMFSARETDMDIRIEQKAKDIANEKFREVTKDITGQLIGLVAIFTALSFVVFGGISSLDSILSSLGETNLLMPTLMVATAWAFCMGNLMFFFMYFVLKITGNEVNVKAKNHVQKYPLTWLLNFICISVFIVCGAIHFAWKHGIGKRVYEWVLVHSTLVFWFGLIVVIGIIIAMGLLVFHFYNKKE